MKWKRTLGELLLLGVLILALNIRQAGSLYPPATEWTRTYGTVDNSEEAHSLIQTDDCGYAMFGITRHYTSGWVYTEDFLLVKTDPAGNVEWNRTYGLPTPLYLESGQSMVQTDDGGYALAGYLSHEGNPPTDYDLWLVKTDSTGNMQWNHTYGGADADTAQSVVQTSDGGYIMTGGTRSYGAGNTDVYLVKTDSTGNMQWNHTYGGAEHDFAYSVVQSGDGEYVIAGFTDSYGAGDRDFWLIKTDSAGNMVWNQTYGGTESDHAFSVVRTSEGGYALGGKTRSFGAGNYDFWLIKTDSAGNMVWNHTYGGVLWEEAFSLVQTSDGGYALLGWTNSWGGGGDYWLVKTDCTGNMQWNQTYGDSLGDIGYSVVQTVDKGYAMAGYSNYYISPSFAVIDFWLVKVCVGDVNGDGLINIVDLTLASFAYGCFEGEPNYNPDADLNSDGIVDMQDIVIIARNLGKTS